MAQTLDEIYSKYDPEQVWTHLFAAAASPSGRHQSTPIAMAIAASLRASGSYETKETLPLPSVERLVELAVHVSEGETFVEDHVPIDPTRIVSVRVGDEVLSYVPGDVERPIADLARALRIAEAIDTHLVQKHDFGVLNVVRVAVKYVDLCVNKLRPFWTPAPDLQTVNKITIPSAEITATEDFLSSDPLETLEFSDADKRALEWMTTNANTAECDANSPTSRFDRYLRYQLGNETETFRWLPPLFVPEVLAHSVLELVKTVESDDTAKKLLHESALSVVRRSLWKFADPVYEPSRHTQSSTEVRPGESIDFFVPYDDELLAVSLVMHNYLVETEGFQIGCIRLRDEAAKRSDTKFPLNYRLENGATLNLHSGLRVTPLVVYAGSSHLLAPQSDGCASLSLEDLAWIAETADDKSDLFNFARDLSDPMMLDSFGFEGMSYWEWWRNNDKHFLVDEPFSPFVLLESCGSESEWERFEALSSLEISLLATGLPPLRALTHIEKSTDGIATICFYEGDPHYDGTTAAHYAPSQLCWQLPPVFPPVSILAFHSQEADREEREFIYKITGGLVHGFVSIREPWQRVHNSLPTCGYLLFVCGSSKTPRPVHIEVPHAPPMNNLVVARWAFNRNVFLDRFAASQATANELTEDALIKLLQLGHVIPKDAEDLGSLWRNADEFLAVEVVTAPTHILEIPPARHLTPQDRHAARLELAKVLASRGTAPRLYEGDKARTLVRDMLAPTALDLLNERVRSLNSRTVLLRALEQLNRACAETEAKRADLARVYNRLNTSWDPVSRMADVTDEFVRLRQSIEIIIEVCLLLGDAACDDGQVAEQAWGSLLGLADMYRTFTLLTESMYYNIGYKSIRITERHFIEAREEPCTDGTSWNYDVRGFQTADAEGRLTGREHVQIPDSVAIDAALDESLLNWLGATSQDLFTTLLILARWNSFKTCESIAIVSENEALDWIVNNLNAPSSKNREQVRHAFKALTCSTADLRSEKWHPWQTRTRRNRLLVKPIVKLDADTVAIAPHFLLVSLSVYEKYLASGVLPWTPGIPDDVDHALSQKRDARNREFEKSLETRLKSAGFKTISRVKAGDHSRLGIPTLTSEIDLVCGRDGDPNIWLIEAKDPVDIHVTAEASKQFRTFFGNFTPETKDRKSYSHKLSRKVAELQPHVDKIARVLEIEPLGDSTPFILKPVFVTRVVVPAGYVEPRPYDVVSLEQFLERVNDSGFGS